MRIFWTSLLLLTAVPALAEPITLPDALRAAIAKRPVAAAARFRAQAAEHGASEANSRYWPRLTVAENFSATDEPAGSLFLALNQKQNVMSDPTYDLVDPDAQKDFETRLSLEQTLFDPDRYYNRTRAQLGAEGARSLSLWREEETAFAALLSYLEVQRAEAADSWVKSSLKEAEEIVRLTEERYTAGLGLKADQLRARVFAAEARRHSVASQNDILLARRRLAVAIGQAGTTVEIAAPLSADSFPKPRGDARLETRPDLVALERIRDAQAAGVSHARAGWLPRAQLQASYAWHDESAPFGSDGAGWAVHAGVNWELFDGFRRSAASGRAQAEWQTAQAEYNEALAQNRLHLEEAQLRNEEARLQLTLAQEAVSAAEESCRLLQQRYQSGLTNLADLLAAQSALDRTRFDAVGAETALLASLARVLFEQGQLLQTFAIPHEEKSL